VQKQFSATRNIYLIYMFIVVVWVLAWILKVKLDVSHEWVRGGEGSFVYWITAKVLVWILPAIWIIRFSGRTLQEVFNLSRWREYCLIGGGIGFLIALTGFVPKYLTGQALLPSEWSFALFNVLIISPIFEEFFIRGALLENLKQKYSFWVANIISSFMFIGLHLSGWYFMGSLLENLAKPIGGALSIFLLSLAFGYAVHRSNSVVGGMLAHFLNNLASLR
jgi:uncharacterized protein